MIFLRLFTGYLIQVVPFTVLAMYPFAHCFRRPKKKTVCLTAALVAGLACVFSVSGCLLYSFLPHDTVLFDAVNLIFLMTLIPCFLWLLAAAKAEAFQKLFVFSFTLTCALAMVSVSNAITTMLYLDTADGLPYQGLTPWILLAFSAAALPALLLLLKRRYLPVAGSLDSKSGRYLAFLSLALFLILASGLSFIDYENLYNPMSAFLFTALLVTVFVIYFIYFRMLFLMNENTRAQQRNSELQHQIALQNEQYKRLNENIENSRRMAHDVRHQLVTLSGFLNDDKIGEAKEYLKENIKEMENYEICRFCDIPAINWVVGYYQLAAKEKGISFSIRIFTPPLSEFPIRDTDISVLLGNLLENAVTAAAAVTDKERYIRLHIIYSGKMLAITVDNSYEGTLKTDGNLYLSTKTGHRGMGLSSIAAVAEKYSGGTEFAHEDGVFHSSVMLSLMEVS